MSDWYYVRNIETGNIVAGFLLQTAAEKWTREQTKRHGYPRYLVEYHEIPPNK